MRIPPEISFRDVPHTAAAETLIRDQAAKLDRFCDHIMSCRVAVERPQHSQRAGNPYRVRIDVTVPPGHEVVVDREPLDNEMHARLETVVIEAFKTMRRRLTELGERQRGAVKTHREPLALIVRLFRDAGYGFLQATDGREVYFHRHAMAAREWEKLAVGVEVRFEEAPGEKGPQATTVQVVGPGSLPGTPA